MSFSSTSFDQTTSTVPQARSVLGSARAGRRAVGDNTYAPPRLISRVSEPRYIERSVVGGPFVTKTEVLRPGRGTKLTKLEGTPALPMNTLSIAPFYNDVRKERLVDVTDHKASAFSLEVIVTQLARLNDGWAGPGSVAPSEAVLNDALAVSSCLPPNVQPPETEVDAEDGCVTLIWKGEKSVQFFAIIFSGNGAVMGVAPNQANYKPWRLPVSDELGIVSKLEDDVALGQYYR
jgi:hypothetical protein